MHVGIIGGGMMGLATAFYLSKMGIQVTVLEKEKEIGGLSSWEEITPDIRWDRFYHVILSTDQELLEFIEEIGLSGNVTFKETKTGFYTDGQLHSMSNISEFLRFKPLCLSDKLRLGAGIFYISKINNWKRLETINARTWLTKVFGLRNYEKMWAPLLRCKLGSAKDQASAALIWAIIKRYYDTRHSSSKKELMGCVKGGYYSILEHIRNRLSENGNAILVDHTVKRLKHTNNGHLEVLCNQNKVIKFDKLVATIPNPQIINLWEHIPDGFRGKLKKVRYLSLVSVRLLLDKSLCPFYITNLTDDGFPFSGLIDATNIIPREVLKGKALIYLPRYLPKGDSFFDTPDEEVFSIFLKALKRIFPSFSESEIVTHSVNRQTYVQPIQEIDYSERIATIETPMDNFYIVNTTMILNSTLNNNQVIRLARKASQMIANK